MFRKKVLVGANRNEIIHLPIKSPLPKAPALDIPLIKTMTNGEYLRLCQKHGVAPIYLDERPKREKRKPAKPEVVQTLGDEFASVTPIELPRKKAKTPPTELAEPPVAEVGRKKSKRLRAKKRLREHRRMYRGLSLEELKRLERKEAKYFPRTASIETRRSFIGRRPVGGGLPGLGKRR